MRIFLAGWVGRRDDAGEHFEATRELCLKHGHEVVNKIDDKYDVILVNAAKHAGELVERSICNGIFAAETNGKLVLVHDMPEDIDDMGVGRSVRGPEHDCAHMITEVDGMSLSNWWRNATRKSWARVYGRNAPFPVNTGAIFSSPLDCLRAIAWINEHMSSVAAKVAGMAVMRR